VIETSDASASAPQIAIDDSGNAIVIWSQFDGTWGSIYVNTYNAVTGWGGVEIIENNSLSASYPQIAFDGLGNAVAVWVQSDGTWPSIWSNTYTSGAGWGTAELIETDNAGFANGPQIAFDGLGNAVAVWYQTDGTRYNIWANSYTSGTGWGTAELIETMNAGTAAVPQIAFDGLGNAVAVWYQSDGTRNNIWANSYTSGTGWGSTELIETDNAGNTFNPQIAFDGQGHGVAVWVQSDGTRNSTWAGTYTSGTGWSTAGKIENNETESTGSPQIAFSGDGTAIATWSQSTLSQKNIWSNTYSFVTGWGSAELLETNDGSGTLPQIAIDDSGNAIVVWSQTDGTRYNIWANGYR
jgi:hypothetical protein